MGWIVTTILLLIVGLVLVGGALLSKENRVWWWLGVFGVVIVWLLSTAYASYAQVGSGELGILYSFSGVVAGQEGPGTHNIAPWDSMTTVNVKTQSVTFDKLDAFSKESQDVYGTLQINYHLDPAAVQNLYKSVGANWYSTFVPGAVSQDFKELTVQYLTVDIAPNRALIAQQLLARLRTDLLPHSIYVDNAFVLSITYSPQFTAAIESKQVASQKVQQAQLEAATARAVAQGQADAAVTIAQGQATANHDIAASLTDQIIKYAQVQKLAGNIKVIVVPANSPILNLGNLTSP